MTARVTIGLPVYNGERFVAEAIDSILSQTYKDWEMVIVDNASTDATEQICRAYADTDPRIRYVRNPLNIGLARNFNLAFKHNRSPYFKWLAHDDVCLPRFLARTVEALDANPCASVAYTGVRAFDGNGTIVPAFDSWAGASTYSEPKANVRFRRFWSNFQRELDRGASQPGVYIFGLMRADAISRTRLMMSHQWADITLLSELLLYGNFVEVPEDMMRARVEIDNATSLMLAGDLRGWQQILDPRKSTRLSVSASRYARYFEAFRSISRSGLSLRGRLELWVFCCRALADRALRALPRQGPLRLRLWPPRAAEPTK